MSTISNSEQSKLLNINFEQTFNFMVRPMYISQFHPYIKRDIKWACKLFTMYVYCLIVVLVLIYSMIFRDLKVNDIPQACSNGVICFTFSVITSQYFVMFYHQKTIQNLMDTMKKDYERAEEYTVEEQQIILEYVGKGKFIVTLWFRISFYGSALFIVRPIFVIIYYHVVFNEFKRAQVYEMVFPSPIEEIVNSHLGIYLYLFATFTCFTIYCMFTILGFQPLGPIFMVHACGQLEVTRTRIMNIFQDSNSVEEISIKLKHVAKSLNFIYR